MLIHFYFILIFITLTLSCKTDEPIHDNLQFKSLFERALFSNEIEIIEHFIEQESPKIELFKDRNENTPAHLTCLYGTESIMAKLLEIKHLPKVLENEDKKTPLHLCSEVNNIESAKELLKNISVVDQKDEQLQTALHISVIQEEEEMTNLLLKKGANPNAKDYLGETPLHKAIYHGNLSLIKTLLFFGADFTESNDAKENIFHIAVKMRHLAILLFLKKEINYHILLKDENIYDENPIDIALQYNYKKIIRELQS